MLRLRKKDLVDLVLKIELYLALERLASKGKSFQCSVAGGVPDPLDEPW